MKTLTMTLHHTENSGSSLQAFALQQFLERNGIENEIIDYVPRYAKDCGHPLKTLAKNILFFRSARMHRKKYKAFAEKNLRLTRKRYTAARQLRKCPPQADWYIVGSDQLWNAMYACGRDPAFYLDFAPGKKLGYAISMGRAAVPEDNLEMVRRYAGDFERISVRERSSVREVGRAYGKPVEYVCDPVLLNPVETYGRLGCARMFQEPYILVYVAQGVDSRMLDEWIEKINEDGKCSVVFIGAYRRKCHCSHHIRSVSPEEFVSLIRYAAYIISNSFHATVFSMLYHRQFVSIVPEENGERIKNILAEVGLERHAAAEGAVPESISEETYRHVDEKLRAFGRQSEKWLLDALKTTVRPEGSAAGTLRLAGTGEETTSSLGC